MMNFSRHDKAAPAKQLQVDSSSKRPLDVNNEFTHIQTRAEQILHRVCPSKKLFKSLNSLAKEATEYCLYKL